MRKVNAKEIQEKVTGDKWERPWRKANNGEAIRLAEIDEKHKLADHERDAAAQKEET